MPYIILETFLASLAISLDSLVASFGYGASKIKIPLLSTLILTFISTLILAISITIGYFLGNIISSTFTKYFSFSLLLLIGLVKLFSELFKIWLAKRVKKDVPLDINYLTFIFYYAL